MPPSDNPDFSFQKKLQRRAKRVLRFPARAPKTKFCYVHVPKCGGNSVTLAFINTVPVTRSYTWVPVPETRRAVSISECGEIDEARYHDDGPNGEKVYAFRRSLASMAMELGHDYVGGHFLYDPEARKIHGDAYSWVTILREPVSRLISHYGEERRSGFTDLEIEGYLDTPMATAHANIITRYLVGWSPVDTTDAAALKATALANLEDFSVVGFLDNMKHFENQVEARSGQSFRIGHSRPGTMRAPDISDAVRDRIRSMCSTDIEIYNAARERFNE